MTSNKIKTTKFSKILLIIIWSHNGFDNVFAYILTVTIVNIGIVPNFFQMWFNIFLTTLIIGFPLTIVVTPFVKNVVDRISY